jgi:hypothetical protein
MHLRGIVRENTRLSPRPPYHHGLCAGGRSAYIVCPWWFPPSCRECFSYMKILVISDIHAYSKAPTKGTKPSYLKAGDTGDRSPSYLFEELLRTGRVPEPDLVVCPGDLGHQVDQAGQAFAWEFLKRVTLLSRKKLLIAATGNHDIDSRFQSEDFDAKGLLLDLRPSYPIISDVSAPSATDDEQYELRYWARNFCLLTVGACRFVVLNSCAFHGIGKPDSAEYKYGRVSERTLTQLKTAIARLGAKEKYKQAEPANTSIYCVGYQQHVILSPECTGVPSSPGKKIGELTLENDS